jgi:hypothetical protein
MMQVFFRITRFAASMNIHQERDLNSVAATLTFLRQVKELGFRAVIFGIGKATKNYNTLPLL